MRRCTGGGAIWHERELTFAFVGGLDLLPTSIEESYSRVHDCIRRAAARFGRTLCPGSPNGHDSRWCFESVVGLDLVDEEGRKTVGSAQRRRGGRFLHHGSIVLARPPGQEFCGALDIPAGPLAGAMAEELAHVMEMQTRVESLPASVLESADHIENSRYLTVAWNHRR
ncbi:MAG: hypothetical protein KDC95_18155 [Planctomycetes bacterium]|nr:hypothetical protein [Planctomycetota bacterium]